MRGIIFDLDDTLYARELFVHSGFDALASHVADSWRRKREDVLTTLRRAHAGDGRGQEFQALCREHRLPLSLVPLLIRAFRAHKPVLTLQPSVRGMLQALRHDGWRLGILTNGDPQVQRRKVEALGLRALVDNVTCAEECAPGGKPDPDAFVISLERLQVSAADCLYVGDDPVCDVGGAHAVGLRTIRVLRPPESEDCEPEDGRARAWQPSDADATVDSVLDVAAIASLVLQEGRHVA